MVATEPTEDVLDVAVSMIDVRCWAAKMRILAVVRVLQRRSPAGVAIIGYRDVARRVGLEERYCAKLLKQMWFVDRVLVRVALPAGSRATGYQVNPRVGQWRNVPWLDDDRETRRLRVDDVRREPDRGTNDGSVPRSMVAAQQPFAPRSLVAALDGIAPRSGSRHNEGASAASMDRGTNPFDGRPSSYSQREAEASLHHHDEDDEGSYAAKAKAAIFARTGKAVWGRPERRLARFEEMVPIEDLLKAIMAAPSDINPQPLIEEWLPMFLKHGPPQQGGTAIVDPEVDRVQRELAKLDRFIENQRRIGEDPDPSHVADRARWQNVYDQLTGAQR